MQYAKCNITDACLPWQFCPPAADAPAVSAAMPERPSGCLFAAAKQAQALLAKHETEEPAPPPSKNGAQCFQLNGNNLMINNILPKKLRYNIPDIKLQVDKPSGPWYAFALSVHQHFVPFSGNSFKCHVAARSNPCTVSYAVSAQLADNEYVAVGFKGSSWETEVAPPAGKHPSAKRPCYFGMCVDSFDNFTSDRIALGYATSSHGACVREMVSEGIVGAPSDVDYKILSGTTVTRSGTRTVMKFSVDQHWPDPVPTDGLFRIMWAVGAISGGSGCNATCVPRIDAPATAFVRGTFLTFCLDGSQRWIPRHQPRGGAAGMA